MGFFKLIFGVILLSLYSVAPSLRAGPVQSSSSSGGTGGANGSKGPSGALSIMSIAGKKTTTIRNGSATREGERGSYLHQGDSIETGKETVTLRLGEVNELQLAPHSNLIVDELSDPTATPVADAEPRDIVTLQGGILWALIASGYSLSKPFFLRTPDGIIGAPVANFVLEYIPASKSFTVLTLEGNLRVAPNMADLVHLKKTNFVGSGYRLHMESGVPIIGKGVGQSVSDSAHANLAKPFKRSLLISYMAKKAREIATDMANRGPRVLNLLSRKVNRPDSTENEITWNIVSMPPPSSGVGGSAVPRLGSAVGATSGTAMPTAAQMQAVSQGLSATPASPK